MPKPKPMPAGEKHNRLTCIAFSHRDRHGHRHSRFVCECGAEKVICEYTVRRGVTKSCGCLQKDLLRSQPRHVTHGMRKSSEYNAFLGARSRCTKPSNNRYEYYGGRGIEFRFSNFEEFFAAVGRKPSRFHSLNRINNDGYYEAGNVEWATVSEQNLNQRQRRWAKKPTI